MWRNDSIVCPLLYCTIGVMLLVLVETWRPTADETDRQTDRQTGSDNYCDRRVIWNQLRGNGDSFDNESPFVTIA